MRTNPVTVRTHEFTLLHLSKQSLDTESLHVRNGVSLVVQVIKVHDVRREKTTTVGTWMLFLVLLEKGSVPCRVTTIGRPRPLLRKCLIPLVPISLVLALNFLVLVGHGYSALFHRTSIKTFCGRLCFCTPAESSNSTGSSVNPNKSAHTTRWCPSCKHTRP